MLKRYPFFLFLIAIFPVFAFAQNGVLRGQVVDATTKQSLPGVTILVVNTTRGAVTDVDGNFVIDKLVPNSYSIRATFVGYDPVIKTDVVIQPSRPTVLNIEMAESATETSVTIQANTFTPPADAPTSLKTLSAEEIRRTPGGQNDISRSLLSVPGVSTGADNRNDLLVRGGGPGENAYFLDGIEIPQINHFATQGATGGPLGMLNVDFMANTEFYTGGFPARYGDALSSLLVIENRPGSPDKVAGDFTVGASETALNLDGPLPNGKGNWFISGRRSYLEFLFKVLGLPFTPNYWDFQTKVEYNLDKNNRISFIGLGAIDDLKFLPLTDPSITTQEIANRLLDNDQWSYTNGVVWRHLYKDGFFNLALSRSMNDFRFEDLDNSTQKVALSNHSQEAENRLRLDADKKVSKSVTLGYGGGATYSRIASDFFQKASTTIPFDIKFNNTLLLWKTFAYGQAVLKNMNGKLTTTLGLRYDGNSFLKKQYISPRFSTSLAASPTVTLNVAVGQFTQSPEYLTLAVKDAQDKYVNQDLSYIKVMQYIGGIGWQARPSLRLSVEGFYKGYSNYPVSKADPRISLANLGGDFGFVGAEPLLSVGKGRAYGLEVFAQKKMVEKLYGLASYSLVWSEFTGQDGVYKPSNWDIRHTLAFTGGYKLGRKWEFGAKWRYTSGNPFTPFDLAKSAAQFPITGQGVHDYSRLNTERMPPYHRLDFRVDRRFFFKRVNGVVYMDIQNLYARTNLYGYNYTNDPAYPDHKRPTEQIGLLPTIGLSIEF